jgi:hypothetical protein
MHTSTSSTTSIPLPPSLLDPNDGRVLLFQLDDPETNEGWRMFSMIDGSYLFEMQTAHGVLISERHATFTDASARADRWYEERTIGKVVQQLGRENEHLGRGRPTTKL